MRKTTALIVILLSAAALRGGYCFLLVDREAFYQLDGRDYADIARNLHERGEYSISYYRWFEPAPPAGEELHREVYRPPLLPALGAVLHHLPGGWEPWARSLQVALGTLCVLMVYLIAASMFGRRCGLLAAAGMAAYPFAVYYSAFFATESLFTLLVMAGFYAVLRLAERGRMPVAVVAGIVMGLACMARPNGLVVAAGLAVWLVVFAAKGKRRMAVGLFAAGLLCVLVPWGIRNYRAARIVTPLTAFGPYNFWMGNNERMYEMYRTFDTEAYGPLMDKLYDEDSQSRVEQLAEEEVFAPAETGRFWRKEALRFIWEHPRRAAYVWGCRAAHYWRPFPNKATIRPLLYWVSGLAVIPLLLLGLTGIVLRLRKNLPAVCLLLIPPIFGMLGALPFVFHLRLRYPTVGPYFMILAAAGLLALLPKKAPSKPTIDEAPEEPRDEAPGNEGA